MAPPSRVSNRQPPTADEVSEENIYIRRIAQTREAIRGVEDLFGNLQGPIAHACQTIEDFTSSASAWGIEHKNTPSKISDCNSGEPIPQKIYPINYLPRTNDSAINKMHEEQFFNPNYDDIARGVWNGLGLGNNFFLDLLHILRSDRKSRTTPNARRTLPHSAKNTTKLDIARAVRRADASTSLNLTRVSTNDSNFTRTCSTQSNSMALENPALTHSSTTS